MNRYPCSGCGSMLCEGRCFLECSADYPTEDERCKCGEILNDGECAVCDAWLIEVRGDPFGPLGIAAE